MTLAQYEYDQGQPKNIMKEQINKTRRINRENS